MARERSKLLEEETTLRTRKTRALAASLFALCLALAGCSSTTESNATASSDDRSDTPAASPSPTSTTSSFPTDAFAGISGDPVPEERAKEFQAALRQMAGDEGMTAAVMSPEGTWAGATGKADGVRDLRVDDQFAIGSVTKTIVAAQVMQMVEAGEIGLDDPADDYLPADLDFDTNGATIRQLLSHLSGIPDFWDLLEYQKSLRTDPKRRWERAEVLALVPADRAPAGGAFEYTDTNYLLLGLVIEQVEGRPVAKVLRDGVLNIDGVDRLIYQPEEKPTAPMAISNGRSTAILAKGGGYLPSLAGSSDREAGGMASDAPSLARWWRAFCAGEIVSRDSLDEMSTSIGDEYGLGLFVDAPPYLPSVGHAGTHIGYAAWAGCMPEDGSIVVVLTNQTTSNFGIALPLVEAASAD